MRRCTWDCSKMHITGTAACTLSIGGERLCEFGYCTRPEVVAAHGIPAPPCCHDVEPGEMVAHVRYGDACHREPTAALFEAVSS